MSDPVLVIAGGSGFLGHSILKKYRDTNAKIVVLTRKKVSAAPPLYENVSYVHWDAATPGD
jgi:NAD dependent epimerase/dehydratase family enzyme